MKKTLEMELKLLAEKILSAEGKTHVGELKELSQRIYENFCVLAYLEELEPARKTTYEQVDPPPKFTREKEAKAEAEEDRYAPDGTHYNPEAITEPNTEKIKNIVEQMPPESPKIHGEKFHSSDFENELRNLGVHYDDLPEFEPVEKSGSKFTSQKEVSQKKEEHETHNRKSTTEDLFEPKINTSPIHTEKKSLNDRLKKGVSFGLNDRLVFIKHLFDGNSGDYDRVLSQLNTFHSFEAAKNFLETVVKPDYNHWKGEEIYENRFLSALETKLN